MTAADYVSLVFNGFLFMCLGLIMFPVVYHIGHIITHSKRFRRFFT